MPLTVSEIAERIANPGADKAAVAVIVGRLRHWTAEGLLHPVGEKSPGTGRHRRYDEAGLEDAALLNEMAELGLQIRLMRTCLILAQDAKTKWTDKAKRRIRVYLEIIKMPDGEILPRLHDVHEGKKSKKGDQFFLPALTSVLINLTQLFGRLTIEGRT